MGNTKQKLLHILWSGEIGGTEEYILTFIKCSDYSRYDIHLCFLSRKGQIYEEAKRLNNVNVAFIGIKNGFDIKGAFKFACYLFKGKFDVIHSHMRNFLSTTVMFFFAIGVPKILTHHVGPVDARLFPKERRFYKLFSGVFKQIIAISGAVKKNLINDLDVKPTDKIRVIHNGIDLNKFNKSGAVPSDLRDIHRPDRYIVGFVGRMEYFKRPLLFIEIAYGLIKKDSKFYFIMVGNGSEFEECTKLINSYGIADHFSLLGFRRDIPEILGLFDAMLFTTAGEGFGIVIIEAMSKKIPVFAINDGAVPEIINHEENGILLNTTDPKIIAQQICNVIKDKKLIDKIKNQCAKDVRSRFSINECVRKMEKVYQSVL
jgi:glycosyltransferase involved in cell wall biosynthesis